MNNSTNFSFGGFEFCVEMPFAILPWFSDDVPYYVAVIFIFTSGFIGNIVTVCVISCWRNLHTPTFTMIACLATSDAYSLLSYTLNMYTNIYLFLICKLRILVLEYCWRTLSFLGRFNAGMQLSLLACLRFTAIVHPLKFKTYCTCKAVIVMSIIVSVIMLIISIVFIVVFYSYGNEISSVTYVVVYAVNFIVPSSLFTVIHCLKLRALRRSPALKSNSSLKMNIVVSIVLSVYIISSGSMMISGILESLYLWPYSLRLVVNLSFLINCAVNPFIYFFSSPPIVQLFRKIWHRLCPKCSNNGNTQDIEMQNALFTVRLDKWAAMLVSEI